jgi:hypothetical protein
MVDNKKLQSKEPLAKCPGIIREKSLGTTNLETPAH